MQQEDAALLALLATNLDRHFGQLVVAYQQRLYAFILRQTGSVQDAEDIVQEALMQAYFALDRYTPQQVCNVALRPWLYKITLNVFYSRLRKVRLQYVPLDLTDDSAHLELEDDSASQPEIVLETREQQHELEVLLNSLPERYRTPINLYYFEGLSYQEIAHLLNLSMNTLKSHLHRGIGHLRKAMTTQQRGGR
jgi:RNA polymerase sigma-70 factor (ECF subfamily)